jgi:histidine triad (HIT) family protein
VASVFTRIIDGQLPGVFVWRDEDCVGILSINPLQPGHALVIPRAEVDHWIDLDEDLAHRLVSVAQILGRAQQEAFRPARIGLLIAGMEVPHAHLHVIPIRSEADLHLSNAAASVSPDELERNAEAIRAALRAHGAAGVADA